MFQRTFFQTVFVFADVRFFYAILKDKCGTRMLLKANNSFPHSATEACKFRELWLSCLTASKYLSARAIKDGQDNPY